MTAQSSEEQRLSSAEGCVGKEAFDTTSNLPPPSPQSVGEVIERLKASARYQRSMGARKTAAIQEQAASALQASEARIAELEARAVLAEQRWDEERLAGDETFQNACGWQARATLAEARLSAALKVIEPFAATGALLDAKPKDDAVWAGQTPAPPITFGHLRAAFLITQDAGRPE